MTAPVRVDTSGQPSNAAASYSVQAAAASVTIDAPAALERYVITAVYALGPITAFTINLGAVTLNFGDHPGLGDGVMFPPGSIVGDKGSAIVITCTGATNIVVLGYIVPDLI